MLSVVTAIGALLSGIGAGLSTELWQLAVGAGGSAPGSLYDNYTVFALGLLQVLSPALSSTIGIGNVTAALGGYLAAPGALVQAILGLI